MFYNYEMTLQVIEQNIAENTKIKEISEVFAIFLETAPALENFSPGLFVTDRSQNDMEPHTFSLCFKYVLLLSLLRRKPFTYYYLLLQALLL